MGCRAMIEVNQTTGGQEDKTLNKKFSLKD